MRASKQLKMYKHIPPSPEMVIFFRILLRGLKQIVTLLEKYVEGRLGDEHL